MCISRAAAVIAAELEMLALEGREHNTHGVHFRILHRYRVWPGRCAPSEEVAAVVLVYRGHEYPVRLPFVLLLLFDYLARHSRLPLSAAQIERGTREDRFYTRPGASKGDGFLSRGIPRAFVRVYVDRIRLALRLAFEKAGLSIDPRNVVITEPTVMNEVGYRLSATVHWMHSAL